MVQTFRRPHWSIAAAVDSNSGIENRCCSLKPIYPQWVTLHGKGSFCTSKLQYCHWNVRCDLQFAGPRAIRFAWSEHLWRYTTQMKMAPKGISYIPWGFSGSKIHFHRHLWFTPWESLMIQCEPSLVTSLTLLQHVCRVLNCPSVQDGILLSCGMPKRIVLHCTISLFRYRSTHNSKRMKDLVCVSGSLRCSRLCQVSLPTVCQLWLWATCESGEAGDGSLATTHC